MNSSLLLNINPTFCGDAAGSSLADKILLLSSSPISPGVGFWNLGVGNLDWKKLFTKPSVEDDPSDKDTMIDSGNTSADTSFIQAENNDQVKVLENNAHLLTIDDAHKGRVLALDFRPLQGLSISHVIKHVEKILGSPFAVLEKVRTIFIESEASSLTRSYRVYIVHYSCADVADSMVKFQRDFLVRNHQEIGEDNIKFIPSSSSWHVATPVMVKPDCRELTWSRILPSDYHVNRGLVKFEFKVPMPLHQVRDLKKSFALLGQVEKFFSLISPSNSHHFSGVFSGSSKGDFLKDTSSDKRNCLGVLIEFCDVRQAKESLFKYMDIPKLDSKIRAAAEGTASNMATKSVGGISKVKPFSDLLFSGDTCTLLPFKNSTIAKASATAKFSSIPSSTANPHSLFWPSLVLMDQQRENEEKLLKNPMTIMADAPLTKAKIPTASKAMAKEKRHFLMAAASRKSPGCISHSQHDSFDVVSDARIDGGSGTSGNHHGAASAVDGILSLDNYVSFLEDDPVDILKECSCSSADDEIVFPDESPSATSRNNILFFKESNANAAGNPSYGNLFGCSNSIWSSSSGCSSASPLKKQDRSPIPRHPWQDFTKPTGIIMEDSKEKQQPFQSSFFDPFRLPYAMTNLNNLSSDQNNNTKLNQNILINADSNANNNANSYANSIESQKYSSKLLMASSHSPASNSPASTVSGRKTTSGKSQMVNNEVNLERIEKGLDKRTTCMIRNIPNKYTQQMIINFINETHKGTYDFLYLRMDFKNRCNVGYAFINFIEPKYIMSFAKRVCGKKWIRFNSDKICSLSYANIQGKNALIEKFRNSSVMEEEPSYRPKIFYSSGPLRGDEEPFPLPIAKTNKSLPANNANANVNATNVYSSSNPQAGRRNNYAITTISSGSNSGSDCVVPKSMASFNNSNNSFSDALEQTTAETANLALYEDDAVVATQ